MNSDLMQQQGVRGENVQETEWFGSRGKKSSSKAWTRIGVVADSRALSGSDFDSHVIASRSALLHVLPQ